MENVGVSRLQLFQSKQFTLFLLIWILGMNLVLNEAGVILGHVQSLITWKLGLAGSLLPYVPWTGRPQT